MAFFARATEDADVQAWVNSLADSIAQAKKQQRAGDVLTRLCIKSTHVFLKLKELFAAFRCLRIGLSQKEEIS